MVTLAEQVEDSYTAYCMERLAGMGLDVSLFSAGNILIKDYALPPGWTRSSTDLIFHLPPNIETAPHGIIIPQDVRPTGNNTLKVPHIPDEYVKGGPCCHLG